MSDVVATTQPGAVAEETGKVLSTDPRFDSFFADTPFEEPARRDDAAQNANAAARAQVEADDNADGSQAAQNAQNQAQDANAQQQQAKEGQQDDTPTYQSLNDLLAAHKIDPESVMGLHVTAKIDGQDRQVPLSDVLKSYQLEGHVNNKSIELSNQRTAFEQERQAVRTLAQQQLQQNQALGNVAMQMLNHDYQRIDWNGLRANDPAQYAALQADFQQRQGMIQNYVAQVQQQAQHEEQQRMQALQQALPQENARMLDARPEWRDPKAFSAARDQMKTYARSIGFQDAELNQINDHRYMLILDDAARYRALQASNPEVLRKVRQAPPMAAPGSRQNVSPQDAQRKSVVERLNRNPRDADAQAAAFEFFANQ
jgi:hypothetical protein